MSTSAFPGLQPIHIKLASIPAYGAGPENLWELAKTQEGGAGGQLDGIEDNQVHAAVLRKNYSASGTVTDRLAMVAYDNTTDEVFGCAEGEDLDLPLATDVHGTFFEMVSGAGNTIAAVTFYVDVRND